MMRSTVLVLAGALACDSGASKTVARVPPAASESREAVNSGHASAGSGGQTVVADPAAVATPPSGSSDLRSEGQPDCRFQRLDAWAGGGELTWLGGCRDGFADSVGVIVNVVEGVEREHFYGRLDQGFPSIGVRQTAGGLVAGRWEHGAVVAPLLDDVAQRNIMLDAFRVAAAAAAAVSEQFRKKADVEASGFYASQARMLSEQLD